MEVIQFVMQFKAKIKSKEKITNEEKIEIITKMLHVKSYMTIRKKSELIRNIILQTITYDKDTDSIIYNSFEKDLTTVIALINAYTDLNINEEGYDLLCSNNLLEDVICSFGKEYQICLGVMNTYMDDLKTKRISLEDI